MAYLLSPGERIGQLVYPGAKRRAFTKAEIELALGGRGYTKIAAGCAASVTPSREGDHILIIIGRPRRMRKI